MNLVGLRIIYLRRNTCFSFGVGFPSRCDSNENAVLTWEICRFVRIFSFLCESERKCLEAGFDLRVLVLRRIKVDGLGG